MKQVEVLIVEDDKMMSFLHQEIVKNKGLSDDPQAFLNGRDALQFLLARDAEEKASVILLDLNMPVMNGWQFLDELGKRDIRSETSVFVVTSSVDRADREKAANYDVVEDYLVKPLKDLSGIREKIQELRLQN